MGRWGSNNLRVMRKERIRKNYDIFVYFEKWPKILIYNEDFGSNHKYYLFVNEKYGWMRKMREKILEWHQTIDISNVIDKLMKFHFKK